MDNRKKRPPMVELKLPWEVLIMAIHLSTTFLNIAFAPSSSSETPSIQIKKLGISKHGI